MDASAWVAIVFSAVTSSGAVWASVRNTNAVMQEGRRAEVRERRATSYLEVLRLVEQEAAYHEVLARNWLMAAEDAEEDGYFRRPRIPLPSKPQIDGRAIIDAHLAAFGSELVRGLYDITRRAMNAALAEEDNLEWIWHEEYGYEGAVLPMKLLKPLLELQPEERRARIAMAEAIASELGHR